MGSAIPQERLAEIVRDARARAGVSVAAAALHVDGRTTFAGAHERPFRIASIAKSFTATAVSLAGLLDERRRTLLSHTAGYRPERAVPHVVEHLGLAPPSTGPRAGVEPVDGAYALDGLEAVVAGGTITEAESDPVTGARVQRRYPLRPDATLMSWRSDFPREGVGRIGWVALPRA